MIFFTKRCVCNACHSYKNIISRNKLLELCYPLLNLNKEVVSGNRQSYSLNSNLTEDDTIKTCLDWLMRSYQDKNTKTGNISEILKLQNIPSLLDEKIEVLKNMKDLKDFVNEEEMKNLVKEEELIYKQQLSQIDYQIFDTIVQHLTTEHFDSVIMEITPGVGGQEAMLFARDLYNMYEKYLNHLGFDYDEIELLKADASGLRKCVLQICNNKAYRKLIYESGVHRVQRVPLTEKLGRIHTSTVVVTITPQLQNFDVKLTDKDLKIEAMKASGAGGQHVNTTDSAIRILHIPTGIAVTSQESRSQIKNKEIALIKLSNMLYQKEMDKQVTLINKMRKKQIGSRSRNEKIRTYNYPQDRIIDHRLSSGTVYNLKEFMRNPAVLEMLVDKLYDELKYQAIKETLEEMIRELK